MNSVIEVKNLVKKYKNKTAINNLSLEIYEGEIVALLGPNGSGKTTTINCILSLLNYDCGDIKIFGKEMRYNSKEIKEKIGVIFQEISVFDELTVYENIDYFCGLYIKNKKKRKEYVEDAIDLVGLNDFKKYYPKKLSGGLLRRLNIACGIAHKPKLIFLDEPTVAVDPQSRNNILEGIKKLRENGATIIYTTHYMEEVEMLCDRVIIIDKGSLVIQGTLDYLKKKVNIKEKITIEFDMFNNIILDKLNKNSNITNLICNENKLEISFKEEDNNLSKIIDFFKNENIKYEKIYSERPSLNDVFLKLTGKELRD